VVSLVGCGKTTYENAAVPDGSTTSTTVPYDGRLHVVFTTTADGPIGGSVGAWKVEPAPESVRPTLTLDEANAKARKMGFGGELDDATPRVYFGLYSGLEFIGNDAQGKLATQQLSGVPAWLVFGRGTTKEIDGGPCCDHTRHTFDPPLKSYGALAFRDDAAANAGISGSISAGGWPDVY